MSRKNFYKNQIINHIKNRDSKILVLGAGKLDNEIFEELNFKNVTFTNIENSKEENLNHFNNIHDINLNENSYDYCVAHACVHHSSRPHQAILELYRVCSKGVLVIEANDSFVSRIACKMNWSEEYELSAVKKNINTGGVDNTNVPNYVYRWTEREIIKLIKSYKPEINHKIYFDYGYQLKFTNSLIIKFIFKLFFLIFKKQQNLFSIYIEKDINKIEFNTWYKK